MPAGRPRNSANHLSTAVDEVVQAIDGLVGTLGRVSARGTQSAAPARKPGPRRPRKGSAKLKAAWANYTPAQRAARIAAMRAGHARRKRERQRRRSVL